MPIEIRELVIRAVAIPDAQAGQTEEEEKDSRPDQDAIIQECVRQVLRIIKRNEER